MREGKNDEMPCGNTAAELANDRGYSFQEEQVIESSYATIKLRLADNKLREPDVFWEAIGLDGAKNGDETAKELANLLMIGNEKSLLAFAEIVRQQVYDYVEGGLVEEAWEEACDNKGVLF